MLIAILKAALVMGIIGLLFGIILGIAAKVFHVEKDERIGMILQVLPCANCGGCGFAGCSAYAEAVVKGAAPVGGCPVGGAQCAEQMADIMGVKGISVEKKVARVRCVGNCNVAPVKYDYIGIDSCFAAAKIAGGPKNCTYGCFGIGTCTQVCPTGAISVKNGVAFVNETKCIGCSKCVNACPRKIIELVPEGSEYFVACSSEAKGPEVMKVCEAGCIGCKLCVKVCENEAVTVENNIAKIDPEKCVGCGLCSEKCPRKVIVKY